MPLPSREELDSAGNLTCGVRSFSRGIKLRKSGPNADEGVQGGQGSNDIS